MLSPDRWEGLGDNTEPRLARKEKWPQPVEAAYFLRVLGSPVEVSEDYLADKLICYSK